MAANRSRRRSLRERLPLVRRHEPMFRWRGTGVSRLEGLADAVFAFTVTLLVVALEVPRDYEGLFAVFAGFPAFAATFAILMWFWATHYTFFRRYGLEDLWTRFLNIVVLLLVVFMAYPLKFLIGSAFAAIFGLGEPVEGIDSIAKLSRVYTVYGAGLAAVWGVYFLMFLHAYRKRRELELTPAEILLTRGSICEALANIAICGASILLAATERFDWQPGAVYALCGPVMGLIGASFGFRASRAHAAASATERVGAPAR